MDVDASALPIKTLLFTVFQSIAEVFLLCLAGYILAYTGVTDKATQRKLNVINVSLFTPALLFSKVAFSLTPSKLKEMWIIPLGFVVITGMSAAVAWVMAKIFKLKRSQTAFAICAAMFQNSNSLPIALVQSLVAVVPGLKWGDDDSKDQMLGRALTYMVLYSTLGMVLRWSWGVQLLANADDEEDAATPQRNGNGNGTADHNGSIAAAASHLAAERLVIQSMPRSESPDVIERTDAFFSPPRAHSPHSPHRGSPHRGSPVPSHLLSDVSAHTLHAPRGRPRAQRHGSTASSRSDRRARAPSRTDSAREFWNLPEQPKHELVDLAEDSSESEAEDEDEWGELPSLRRRTTPAETTWTRTKASLKRGWDTFNKFMTVPTWAALISIIIALIPPLQAAVSSVHPFVAAIKSAGQCSIPVTLVVLGAFFYTPPPAIQLPHETQQYSVATYINNKLRGIKTVETTAPAPRASAAYPGENRTVFVAIMARMVIVPLLFLPIIALLAHYDPVVAAEDPVFILCCVLLVSSPPALTLAQLTQAASGDAFERLISKTISWSYAVLTPPLTLIYVVLGLLFSKL